MRDPIAADAAPGYDQVLEALRHERAVGHLEVAPGRRKYQQAVAVDELRENPDRIREAALLAHFGGRPSIALEWLYDSAAMRSFVGIDRGREPAPDETTVCKFRHRLEKHGLGKKIFAAVRQYLQENGLKVSTGTIVDATIISAPSSTKNQSKQRDPEMHQTAKGKQWYFGMKAHVAIDSKTKMIHTVLASAVNVTDRDALPYLLHVEETRVWGD